MSNEKIAAGGLAAAGGFGYTRCPMKAVLPAVLSLFAAAALAQEEAASVAPAPAGEPAPAESSEDEWHPMTEDEENAAKAVLSAALDESFAAAKEKFGADTNRYFVARGVLADREARTVRLDAFATGIRPGAIAEFLLITLNSGHEYESVFQTFALAADIARAFEFIGVPPGLPADFSAYRFWPRGERFEVEAEVDGAPAVPADDEGAPADGEAAPVGADAVADALDALREACAKLAAAGLSPANWREAAAILADAKRRA